jgi:hypothetical protein
MPSRNARRTHVVGVRQRLQVRADGRAGRDAMNKFSNEFCTVRNELRDVSAEELNQFEGGGIIDGVRDFVGRFLANVTGGDIHIGNHVYVPDVVLK